MDTNENVIEFFTGDKSVLCTFTSRKFIRRCKELAEKYPEEVEIRSENADGSIVCKLPLKYIHINNYSRPNSYFSKNKGIELEVEDDERDETHN